MKLTLTIDGLPETVRQLEQLPRKVQKRAIGKALRAGTAPTIKAARRLAPRATGLLKRSLAAKFRSYQGGAVQVEIVGQAAEVKNRKKLKAGRGGISGRGGLVPVHLLEEGTRPHTISRGVVPEAGPRNTIRHPGVRGRHFLRQAAESTAAQTVELFSAKLRTEVDAAASSS